MEWKQMNRSFKKYMALMLAAVQVFAMGFVFPIRAAGEQALPSPVVYYGGAQIQDGLEIPENAWLALSYQFTTAWEELSGALMQITLPEPLIPAWEDISEIYAYDESGNPFQVGTLTVGEDGVTAAFASVASKDGQEEPLIIGEISDDSIPDSAGYGQNSQPEPEPEAEPELLTVSFDILCMLNPAELPEANEDGFRQVTIESGGLPVTVSVTTAVAEDFLPMPMDLTSNASLDQVVSGLLGALYIWDGSIGSTGDWRAVGSNETVKPSDRLEIIYDFSMTQAQVEEVWNSIMAGVGDYYVCKIPTLAVLEYTDVQPIILEADVAGIGKKTFATLSVDSVSGDVNITFGGDFWALGYPFSPNYSITSAEISVLCQLKDNLTVGSTETVVLLCGTSVGITVGEDAHDASPHGLTKAVEVADAEACVYRWTVTYTVGDDPVVGAGDTLTFTDTLGGTYGSHGYYNVAGMTAEKNGMGLGLADGFSNGLTDGNTSGTWTVTGPLDPEDELIFTYYTKLNDDAFNEANYSHGTAITNSVGLSDGSGFSLAPQSINHTVSSSSKRYLGKTGEVVTNLTDGTKSIKWTITIHTRNRLSGAITLTDTLPAGLALVGGTAAISLPNPTSASVSAGQSGQIITFNVSGLSSSVSSYTLIYETSVAGSTLLNANGDLTGERFANSVVLDSSPWNVWGTKPGATYATTVPNGLISKTGTGAYNAGTHVITWTVTVNPNHYDVRSGTITDDLNALTGGSVTYVAGSFENLNSAAIRNRFSSFVVTDNELTAVLQTSPLLGTNSFSFKFQTYVDDPLDYAYNTTAKTYTNTVEFDGTVYYGAGDISVKDQASGTTSVTSTVLAKEAGAYDYNDNTVSWTVTVNQNKMPMDNVKVIDTLPQYLSFVEIVSVTPQSAADYLSADPGRVTAITDPGGGTTAVTFDLGSITDTVVIVYKTKAEVDEDASFKSDTQVSYGNEVWLTRDAYGNQGPISTSVTINNSILGKTGVYKSGGKIAYTVTVNPNGVDMHAATQRVQLTDTLPDGLTLDIDSVKLYAAIVSGTGGLSAGAQITAFEWFYNVTDNVFTVTLPENNGRYVLAYDCFVMNGAGIYDNDVALTGTVIDQSVDHDTSSIIASSGWAMAAEGTTFALVIEKQDTTTGNVLGGVEFELWTEVNGQKITYKGLTDSSGKLTFQPLRLGRNYWLVESVPVEGYGRINRVANIAAGGVETELDEDEFGYKINLTAGDLTFSSYYVTVYNDHDIFTFDFHKVNDYGRYLTGVIFELTSKSDPDDVRTAASASGLVTFSDVPWGEYELKETQAADGHYLNEDAYTVTIAKNGAFEITNADGLAIPEVEGMGRIVNKLIPVDKGGTGGSISEQEKSKDSEDSKNTEDSENTEDPGNSSGGGSNSGGSEGSAVTPPPGVTPHDPGNTFVLQDDGSWIEVTSEGVPLGRWLYDEDADVWIFDEFPPLGTSSMPQTGGFPMTLLLVLAGAAFIGAGIWISRKKPDSE